MKRNINYLVFHSFELFRNSRVIVSHDFRNIAFRYVSRHGPSDVYFVRCMCGYTAAWVFTSICSLSLYFFSPINEYPYMITIKHVSSELGYL